MNRELIHHLFRFVALFLLQMLVLNHIHLFGCATPLVYVSMVVYFRANYPKWGILLWAFAMGLAIDTTTNTPGLAAVSLTLVALIQPYLLRLFIPRDSPEDFAPNTVTLGVGKFAFFLFVCVFVYTLVFFSLEAFSFFNPLLWAENVGGSTLLTLALILVTDNLRKH